jgi:hypothetical protein
VLSAASGNRYCHFSYEEEEGEERAVSASAMALSVDTFRPSSVMVRAVRSARSGTVADRLPVRFCPRRPLGRVSPPTRDGEC